MEVRCYKGSVGRTRMKQLKFGKVDILILLIMTVFIGFFLLYSGLSRLHKN